MSAQGLKNAGDHTNDTKPGERRRGAAGRAAVLRRAPSDSDCSGETASLSADSGERRPAPPPPRSGKTRSRRRGSEWEVLEGLKDGQRFERRPEVFNGYLHKKRKWPLKGWHKRFFVVDGGILVYARSPTDVARGRLHGSLDVGLSVISAKPRRRRIDIDADEFIYHLRAKTPDVFRTWLNVLKAHRLYRQHLLTFGARESVPKIHAPLDEIPPTDTSSRVSHSSAETFSTLTNTSRCSPGPKLKGSPTFYLPSSRIESSHYDDKSKNVVIDWKSKESSSLLPLKLETIDVEEIDKKLKTPQNIQNGSLCSMCCMEKRMHYENNTAQNSQNSSVNNDEKHLHSTNLDLRVLKSMEPNCQASVQEGFKRTVSKFMSTFLGECNLNPSMKDSKINPNINKSKTPLVSVQSFRKHLTFGDKSQTTLFFFSRKNRNQDSEDEEDWIMRRSKKSTNLVKYRNSIDEPLLKRPLSKCMLLAKYKLDEIVVESEKQDTETRSVLCDLTNPKDNKSVQDTMTSSEYDNITEKLILTIFGNRVNSENYSRHKKNSPDSKFKVYVNQVVKELYNVKLSENETHPVTYLFKSLLDYYLKNTGSERIKYALQKTKSVEKQSNKHFTKDAMISSEFINSATKETQVFEKRIEVRKCETVSRSTKSKLQEKKSKCEKQTSPDPQSPKGDTDSFEKERRIQELERLMKNTVYLCETVQSMQSKENDIKITKTLINNLSKFSKKSVLNKAGDKRDNSDESAELPAIQDTINRLISETDMPPEMAKEFLHMYLDVLCNESSKNNSSTSQSSETSKSCKNVEGGMSSDGVQTESVIKKISKSVTTDPCDEANKPSSDGNDQNKKYSMDSGQLYLQEMLDEITTVFAEGRLMNSKLQSNARDATLVKGNESIIRTDLQPSTSSCPNKHLIYEVKDDNSVVIDLSKYDLHRISMVSDTASEKMVKVKIKLKEKPAEYGEWKRKHLSLKFSNDHPKPTQVNNAVAWPRQLTGATKQAEMHFINIQAPFIHFDPKDHIELKPYLSTSDATSKANHQVLQGSGSFGLSQKSDIYPHLSPSKVSMDSNDDAQCFLLSSLKKKVMLRGKNNRQLNGIVKSRADSPPSSSPKQPDGLTVFEKEPPGIIDERFILLLLENLTLLSKNLPGMYKEINNMYLKLKKRHDKTNTNAAKLSLLGKIYKGPTKNEQKTFDGTTQFDASMFPESTHDGMKEAVQVAVNTSIVVPNDTNVLDKSVSALELSLDRTKQIMNSSSNPEMSKEKSIETQTSYTTCQAVSIENAAIRKDQSVSIQEWCNKLTRECAISTVIKCFLNNDDLMLSLTKASPEAEIKKPDDEELLPKKFKNKQSAKVRQDLMKQIKLLSSSFRVSTHSQTEKKLNRHANCFEKDFRVYQLFPKTRCKLAQSRSGTDTSVATDDKGKSDDLKTLYRCSSVPSYASGLISPNAPPIRGPQAGFVTGTPGGRLASWIIESGGPLESASRELGQAQLSVQQLQRLLDALELQQQLHHDTDVSIEGASPNVKKDRRKFGLRKKKSNNKCGSVDLACSHLDPSSSQMALSTLTAPPSPGGGASSMPNSAASLPIACAAARPQSLPGAEALAAGGPTSLTSLTPDHQLREDFTVLAKDLVASLKTIVSTLVCERGRLRAAMDAADNTVTPGSGMVAALRTNLSSALQQNSELRSRLSRIHDASDLAELSLGNNSDPQVGRQFPQSLSYSSSCVSASEFFDAEEHDDEDKPAEIIATDEAGVIELDGDSSSEAGSLSSEEGSASGSDNSDGATSAVLPARALQNGSGGVTPRRARLPCPRPTPASPSLWNLLYKNIGKDLSQISMPVTINEPLNMLQRLCEELEYSELLDSASECSNEIDRMCIVAAFAVSAYAASAHRAASKPFNPLLGETYECVRPDRDFRFIAEQVSHHPPISACHAESPRWTFWQEARIKTKFWGKSMEFQPTGRVHVRLAPSGDHYSWNKVTTCVHNLFGGQRWVDQYGDMHIVCHGTDITCKLNFVKASAWSGSRHEVRGAVLCGGSARARLQGRWSEGLHAAERPLWRPGAMPPDYELYYGFTRFAMELNELEPGMREILPNTDTRLRPDQRALEEGDVDAAEQFKLELEQAQRERRRDGVEHRASWFRKSVEDGEETWVFTGEYWKAREAGFGEGPRLW